MPCDTPRAYSGSDSDIIPGVLWGLWGCRGLSGVSKASILTALLSVGTAIFTSSHEVASPAETPGYEVTTAGKGCVCMSRKYSA